MCAQLSIVPAQNNLAKNLPLGMLGLAQTVAWLDAAYGTNCARHPLKEQALALLATTVQQQ
jgi:hypothetical protein